MLWRRGLAKLRLPVRGVAVVGLTVLSVGGRGETPGGVELPQRSGSSIVIPAAPQRGFNHPYVLLLPSGMNRWGKSVVLVEPFNSGHVTRGPETDLAEACDVAETGMGAILSRVLALPLVLPVFPRFEELYTHSLSRGTLESGDSCLRRIDLQVLAMVEDAKSRLAKMKVRTREKFLLTGFSASGAFVNRFAMLHPEKVQAVAAGGVNGMLLLPLEELDSELLPYPIGVADLEKLVGRSFQRMTWLRLPQFIYMGARDTCGKDDAVRYPDAYSPSERDLIFELLGRDMQPERWHRCQELYLAAGANVEVRTYDGVGHDINGAILADIADFFGRAMSSAAEP